MRRKGSTELLQKEDRDRYHESDFVGRKGSDYLGHLIQYSYCDLCFQRNFPNFWLAHTLSCTHPFYNFKRLYLNKFYFKSNKKSVIRFVFIRPLILY